MEGTLQTKMFLGRMLRNSIKDPLDGMAEQMKWKQPFLLVEVTGDKFGMCGNKKCLRVRETPTWNTGGGGRTWDLVITPECLELAEEMIRPEYLGVKKTVCIWNADVSPYPKPWIDGGGAHVSGEIFLKPTRKVDEKILTVVIFHHGGLGNFEGVPVQILKAAEENKVVKMHTENFRHCELMIAKLYSRSMPNGLSVAENKPGSVPMKSSDNDMYLSSSSTSVVTSNNEDIIAGNCDHGLETDLIIDETDYGNSDADSETMSVDVMKEANKEIHELAKYLLGLRK